ncbi:hypothetical protein DFJ63DRAFT_22373 [Scheffersomyces coipomensis]|uniref:uncharacterized protein n=1 Tax=Scheffersomyces coipomensis TaxID=1788519 RepID=UPI00315D3B6E
MTVGSDIKSGEKALAERDYLGAIGHFTSALKENPTAFQALLNRANAYTKLKNYEAATKDISAAYTTAQEKGRRNDIGLCYFRLANIYYLEKNYKLAVSHINKAIALNGTDPTYSIWKAKFEMELKKNPQLVEVNDEEEEDGFAVIKSIEEEEPEKESKIVPLPTTTITSDPIVKPITDKPSTSIDVINQQAPLKIKIREDWYQTNDTVIVTIFAKGVNEDKLHIEFDSRSVQVSFPTVSSSEYSYNLDPLYAEIDETKSSYKVYGTKLEVKLVKKVAKKWPTLEGSGQDDTTVITSSESSTTTSDVKNAALTYPTSSKKAINWSNFAVDDVEEEKNDMSFFTDLYKDVDDDTKRAMMKSYVQSNGTVLTTNWKEAKDKEFETSPPEGMQAKKWDT